MCVCVQDRDAPESVHLEYQNVAFDARLAEDDTEPDVIGLIDQPGADGFSLDSSPLFQVPVICLWLYGKN